MVTSKYGIKMERGAYIIRNYKEDYSKKYPIPGIIFLVLTVLCILKCGVTVLCLRNLIFLGCLFYLTLSDLKSYTIPDGCLLISVIAWGASIPFAFPEYGGWNGILFHLLAAAVYGGGTLFLSLLIDGILKKESLGGGDIKLFAVMGLYLGMNDSLYAVLLACLLTLAFMALCRKKLRRTGGILPFGPAIAVATWWMLLYDFV